MKKMMKIMTGLILVAILTACSTTSATSTSGRTNRRTTTTASQGTANAAKMPVSSKLVIGTLRLEGTAQAVTEDQAKTLLPLYKALKVLSKSDTTAAEELTALYNQIESTMTSEQIKEIEAMTMTPQENQTLMEQLGIKTANATTSSKTTTSTNRGGFGGPEGMMPPGGGDPMMGGTASSTQTTRTARASTTMGLGQSQLFIDPLITVLKQRAGIATAVPATDPALSATPTLEATPKTPTATPKP